MVKPTLPVSQEQQEALSAAFAEYLQGHLYICHRDESAWAEGTMGLDDFSPAAESEEVLDSLVEIALTSLGLLIEPKES